MTSRTDRGLRSVLAISLKNSCQFGPHHYVQDWRFFCACFAATIGSLAAFVVLETLIRSHSEAYSKSVNLQIFDYRNGYSPLEVNSTLDAWGPRGRLLYLFLEVIDCTIFHFAYRGCGLVVINRLATSIAQRLQTVAGLATGFATVPLTLAYVDFFENCAQVAMVLLYPAPLNGYWSTVVQLSSTINTAKWSIVRMASPILGLEVTLLVGLLVRERIFGSGKPVRRDWSD